MPNSTLPFQPYCPSGGTFYVCNTSKSTFIGCCNSDPCSSVNGCSAGSLEPASFDPAKWGTFPDQNCDDGRFWTCAATKPAFLGCCKSNPCAIGSCPVGDLAGMRLSDDPKKAAAFLGTSSAISSSTTPSNSTSTAMPAEIPHQTGLPVAAIGGIAIGIVLLLALAIVMFFLWRRTVRLRKSVESSRGLPGQDGFDNLSGTTYPAMAHAQQGNPLHVHLQTCPTNRRKQHTNITPTHPTHTPPSHPHQTSHLTYVEAISPPLLAHLMTLIHVTHPTVDEAHNSALIMEWCIRRLCRQYKNSRLWNSRCRRWMRGPNRL